MRLLAKYQRKEKENVILSKDMLRQQTKPNRALTRLRTINMRNCTPRKGHKYYLFHSRNASSNNFLSIDNVGFSLIKLVSIFSK